MPTPLRLIIVDDDSEFLETYQDFFADEPEFDCVGVATNGQAGIRLWREQKPDVTLMDLSMPTMPGVEAIQAICHEDLSARIVALTSLGDSAHVDAALQAGASGYLMKGCGPDELLQGLRDAHREQMPLTGSIRQTVVDLLRARRAAPIPLPDQVTPQEAAVLRFLVQGLSNRDIADKMSLSEASIKTYLSHLYVKFHVKSRNQLLVSAINCDLIDPRVFPHSAIKKGPKV